MVYIKPLYIENYHMRTNGHQPKGKVNLSKVLGSMSWDDEIQPALNERQSHVLAVVGDFSHRTVLDDEKLAINSLVAVVTI